MTLPQKSNENVRMVSLTITFVMAIIVTEHCCLVFDLYILFRGDVSVYYEDKMNNVTSNHTACVQNVYSYTTAFLFFIETETSVGYGGRAITEHCPEAVLLFVIQVTLFYID